MHVNEVGDEAIQRLFQHVEPVEHSELGTKGLQASAGLIQGML
jgi:hypothetical protein